MWAVLGGALSNRLLERIRAGEFQPGDQLPSERDLMQAYQVGRPAVREALQERPGIGPSRRDGDRVLVPQHEGEGLGDERVVVDEEDGLHGVPRG